ncbi:hypothetical protein [Burkholderia mallei]|nr:hypothetical protein [Burkholderia mallei]ABM51053.1 HAD-superfamily hydrolase, subfamily IA, variant 3:HAD-superfamily hydrolase, subfamily IA, variant 1 [Burkholderia mallei SAVP1]EEP85426.1 HAD-superfamily hydrolase [Burkholderia mallei GB8 horse 4]KGC52150.1 putative phosphoglycolate phosphatase [Burkholderia mallei]KOS75726.1 putative phosphoglycolate phosphatase [Burkholderia mallei]KOS85860.1 putative phosphoglycolate phosphatase [Burkholderia mallei]
MARQQFDLIVFDWDGTLMDSTAHIAQCCRNCRANWGRIWPAP